MKIEEFTPPVERKYRLELTESQLLGLGILSYRHEDTRERKTFYRMLPIDLQNRISKGTLTPLTANYTTLDVDWGG